LIAEGTHVAQRVVTEFVDDIDGSPAGETVAFALDGVSYEIDLSPEHTEELREVMSVWAGYARRVGGRARRALREAAPAAAAPEIVAVPADSRTVRSWAQANGIPVPVRGRIPGSVREQFEAANG
jgi:Lsr2